MTELTDEAVKALAAARPGNLFVDQDEDVCIDDGRKFNLIFCPARDDVELEGDWPVLNPEVVAEIVARYNIAPVIARALLDARAERDRLRADAQATNGVWQANLRLQAELAAVGALRERAEKAEAKCSQIGRELNTARYGQPDFAWSIHKEVVSELRDELAAAQQREAGLLAAIEEATDPDFILGAMDNVNDMDVTLDGFAQAASRAIRAALAHNGRGE